MGSMQDDASDPNPEMTLFSLHHNIKFHTEHHLISSLDFSLLLLLFFIYFLSSFSQLASDELITKRTRRIAERNIKVKEEKFFPLSPTTTGWELKAEVNKKKKKIRSN